MGTAPLRNLFQVCGGMYNVRLRRNKYGGPQRFFGSFGRCVCCGLLGCTEWGISEPAEYLHSTLHRVSL